MKPFPWWTDEQKAFQKELSAFVKTIAPRDALTRWTREFPWDIYEKFGKTGFTGAAIPKEYGGLGLGCTGSCILAEELHNYMPGVGRVVVGNMNGGLMQVVEAGTEEQKKRFLPDIAAGELGAVVITEMTAGTDAAGVALTAKKDGDNYVLNGRKRFIVGAGVADRYFVYARTSDNPDDAKKRKHISCFIVKKGMPGFETEKINEILGFENCQNGSLIFDDVVVPAANMIGHEGEGWKIMMGGLDFERTNIAAGSIGWQRILLRNVVPYSQRRVQFGKPTIDIQGNQDKIADIAMRLRMTRASVYYTAYLWDLGEDISVDASAVKCMGAEMTLESAKQATQIMAGDGVNRTYPVQNIYELAKTEHVAGGTVEACRISVFRNTLKVMEEDIQMQRRVIDPVVGVPLPSFDPVAEKLPATEENVLAVLAEDYRSNPGLHMTPEDIKQYIDADDAALEAVLVALESSGDIMLLRNKKGISLAKAAYQGLSKAHPNEYYKWFPTWCTEEHRF